MTLTATAIVLSWVAIIVLASALAGVLARVHRLEQRLAPSAGAGPGSGGAGPTGSGPGVGATAPPVPGVVLDDGVGAVLLFADRECGSCLRVLPTAVEAGTRSGVPVHVLWSSATAVTNGSPPGVTHHPDAGAAYVLYGVVAAPWLVVVAPDGRIAATGAAGSVARAAELVAVLDLPDDHHTYPQHEELDH
jgi:hypothetical protein